MATRICDCGCGASLEGLHGKRRFFSDACRKASKRRPAREVASAPVPTNVSDALGLELTTLGLIATYEGQVAMGLAAQLEDGSVRGAAYASLSRELDRRVEALRMKADLPDDPARLAEAAVAAKRAQLKAV